MALISFLEILNLAIMTLVIGYIFSGSVPLQKRRSPFLVKKKFFEWERVKIAMLVTAPGVVFHELAHKFAAILYGYSATFQIFPLGLGIGLVLKLVNSPFLFVAPGYVQIPAVADAMAYRLIAFAGPAVNLVLWLGSWFLLKTRNLKKKWFLIAHLTKNINMILFFFNMIPFGFFDGAKVVFGP
ncbi:M50 family metallopeptidase [Candidatus Woesearchaeota archaeon]|nr:M50 family metallopeptidase [Candidatus Woesearchaeota archaeon]